MESHESLFDDVHGLEPLFHALHPGDALLDSLLYQVLYFYRLFLSRIQMPSYSHRLLHCLTLLPLFPYRSRTHSHLYSPLCALALHPVKISRAVLTCFSSQQVVYRLHLRLYTSIKLRRVGTKRIE